MPFREAHGIVAGLVRYAVDRGKALSELTDDELAELAPALDAEYHELLRDGAWLESKVSEGGTSQRPRPAISSLRPATSSPSWTSPRGLSPGPDEPAFYERPVARWRPTSWAASLRHGGCVGRIVETEAYHESEPACHAYVGADRRAPRSCSGPPGTAYVYRSYGVHALLNAVCEDEGVGAAVLIRALEPLDGPRCHARAPRPGASRGPLLRARQAHPGAGHRARAQRQPLGDPIEVLARAGRSARSADRRRARASASRGPWSCRGGSATPAAGASRARCPPGMRRSRSRAA